MYTYRIPNPVIIELGRPGFDLRQKTYEHLEENLNATGAQRGSKKEQGYGLLAEVATRDALGLPSFNPEGHPVTYDFVLPSGVKVDVKCRGGEKAFQTVYQGTDGLPREAKHNLFARQVHAEDLDADIYLLTHLQHPKGELPGTSRQRNWRLFVCGWVSKARVLHEGVYLPPGALSERGRSWFDYRSHEIEFYDRNLNGIADLADLRNIDRSDVVADANRTGMPNLTSVDAIRIGYDLIGHGVLNESHLQALKEKLGVTATVKPILHANQYHHLLEWMKKNGLVDDVAIQKLGTILKKEEFTGL